jgi:hypothetical protein
MVTYCHPPFTINESDVIIDYRLAIKDGRNHG